MKKIRFAILLIFISAFCFFFVGQAPKTENIVWGVNFSQKQAEALGLDWQKTYLALIEDLGAKNIKLAVYWDLLEPERGRYDFSALDWQVKTAEEKGAKILLAMGVKVPRWPECHIPSWAGALDDKERQEEVLAMLEKTVLRYEKFDSIVGWQVENEPLFPFGRCPKPDKDFLKKEADLVKSLSTGKPVIISDSGEGSFWFKAAGIGDIVGTTIYRKAWFEKPGIYVNYPFPPVFYWRKAELIEKFFNKKVICVELQAEPWGPKLIQDSSVSEQEKTMGLSRFRSNVEFAEKTGLDKFYLWGGEWWYWLKEKQNKPEIWDEAKKLFLK